MSSEFTISKYSEQDSTNWDDFCSTASNSTFQHTRKFLSYHKDRFSDFSLIILKGDKIVGLLPLAIDPENNKHVVSHPGATYGGVVRNSALHGKAISDVLSQIKDLLHIQGFNQLTIKHVPHIYHLQPCQDEIYSIWQLGGKISRVLLSSSVDLSNEYQLSSRRKRAKKLAIKEGISIRNNNNLLPELWNLVTKNLEERHSSKPVHNLEEIQGLATNFEENISTYIAYKSEEPVAGVLVFKSPTVWHAQYIASNELGRNTGSLDLVFHEIIQAAKDSNIRYFDFGTSNEDQGQTLNNGLYEFKSEFGGGGIIHQFSSLDL